MQKLQKDIGIDVSPEYPLIELSPSAFKVYSAIVLQIKKSKVPKTTVAMSFTQIRDKTLLSYATINKCVKELEDYPEIIEVKRSNGNTIKYTPNMRIVL